MLYLHKSYICISFSIANAVIDLLLLAAWTLALETINGDPIPVLIFGIYFIIAILTPFLTRYLISPEMIVCTKLLSND